jgi:hypothetical protein
LRNDSYSTLFTGTGPTAFGPKLPGGLAISTTALIGGGNVRQKHVWRAEIIFRSGDGVGTVDIKRETGKSRTRVWR